MTRFETTRWSLIAAARDDPAQARGALEQLCRAYRPPVLAYIRRAGCPAGDAEDLTQAFFLHFLEHGWYGQADPARGRFRSLLLAALGNFLRDQHARAVALKRGGAAQRSDATLDGLAGTDSPEQAFTREWLATVLGHAMQRLREEWVQAGKLAQFERLSPLLLEHADSAELKRLAGAQGMRSNTLAVQSHRMRQRLRQLVRLELLQTVGSREALEAELAELRMALDASA